ncbi:MAG TPA: methyl-accepting chemotaxis protein [Telluria sp.]|nr:methyl-accepting chemotaxis protein [Telluria sp.]
MLRLSQLNTRGKLFFAFALIMALLMAVSALAYRDLSQLKATQQSLFSDDLALALDVQKLRSAINRERVTMLSTLADGANSAAQLSAIEQEGAKVDQLERAIEAYAPRMPLHAASLTQFGVALNAYQRVRDDTVMPALRAGRRPEATAAIVGPLQTRFQALREQADRIGDAVQAQASARMREVNDTVGTAQATLLGANLVAVALAVLLVLMLDRILAAPLRQATGLAQLVGTGDLTVAIPRTGQRDETGALLDALDNMVVAWSGVMRENAAGIGALNAAATDILAASTQAAASSAETAAAVAETSATVEEVKQTALLSNEKAHAVSDAAQRVAEVAERGRTAIEGGVLGMGQIQEQMDGIGQTVVRLSERSQAIGDIIATVGSLAEQSNLLAVNAAIEAAKAGEQGRGFAIVAQEVRALADQSRQATRQVRQILGEIEKGVGSAVMIAEQAAKTVARGVEQANEAGAAINHLADSVSTAAEAALQIAASSQQQLAGMDQVAMAMQNIKQASADHASGSRQSEGAARRLHELGQQLSASIARFRFG